MPIESAKKILAIGGSAGSVEILLRILPKLPAQFPFAVACVLHLPSDSESLLPSLLREHTACPVSEVEDKETILPSRIYIGPANYHLLIESEKTFALNTDEPVRYSRPSIDVFFESVANTYGKEAMGLLLSGANQDGALGLQAIQNAGGEVCVQDPAEAEANVMPKAAVELLTEVRILKLPEIENWMIQLSRGLAQVSMVNRAEEM